MYITTFHFWKSGIYIKQQIFAVPRWYVMVEDLRLVLSKTRFLEKHTQ